jgi:hypothetical protein
MNCGSDKLDDAFNECLSNGIIGGVTFTGSLVALESATVRYHLLSLEAGRTVRLTWVSRCCDVGTGAIVMGGPEAATGMAALVCLDDFRFAWAGDAASIGGAD